MAKNILIVDNDKGFSTILTEGLNRDANFRAVAVNSCTVALQYVVEKPIDLVIIDMGLSDMAPPKLVAAIREARNGMPIMITPIIGQPVPDAMKSLDIQGVVPKPFFVGDLPQIVGKALGLDLDSQVPDIPVTKKKKPRPQPKPEPPPRRTPEPEPEPVAAVSNRETVTEARPAPAPTPASRPSPPADTVFLPTLPSWKLERLRKHSAEIVSQLDDMNRDFRAEVILLTAGSELIAKAGTMRDDRAKELAILVAKGAEAAAQAAAFLGERAERFEQSLHEGNEYRLYSYSLGEGVVLSLALSTSVPLGILRHQTKRTSQELMREYID